ncbi:hypothetical protein [Cohnella zeiphila]|uniref:Uncharacterized protein n=1 Tax=Cohnella zeiphila TaxID=2761120 RepID=A0A7X0STU8_9BACL|nr:hypothetical protein [Cohnella zeiphila]MBB6735988.1 hypothetical protein [Cohnella zeiphila]
MAVKSKSRAPKKPAAPTGGPVCVVLRDGRYYVGWVRGVRDGQLVLSGLPGSGRMPASGPSRRQLARISALVEEAEAAAAGGAAAGGAAAGGLFGGLGSLTDLMGFMSKALPVIQMGMNMVKTIMPLLGGLKA